jgi:polyferredoxin
MDKIRQEHLELTHPRDAALRVIGFVAIIASIVMAGGAAWLFANGEPRGAWTVVVVLVLGYAAMGSAWAYANRKG